MKRPKPTHDALRGPFGDREGNIAITECLLISGMVPAAKSPVSGNEIVAVTHSSEVQFSSAMTWGIATLLACSAGILGVIFQRSCVRVLGVGWDGFLASGAMFWGALGSGFFLFRSMSQRVPTWLSIEPVLILGTMTGTVLAQRLTPAVGLLASGIGPMRTSSFADLLICMIVAAAFEFIPAACIGGSLAQLWFRGGQEESVRRRHLVRNLEVLLPSAVGCAVGWVLASKCLINELGTTASLAFGIGLLTGILFLKLMCRRRTRHLSAAWMLPAGVALYSLGTDPVSHSLYGQAPIALGGWDVRYFHEGSHGDLRLLVRGADRLLQFDGIPLAGTGQPFLGELGLADLPRLMRPESVNVLVIGLGAGVTCGASLRFPSTKVICIEPEPAAATSLEFFKDINYQPNRGKSFSITPQDPIEVLAGRPSGFDLILITYADAKLPVNWRLASRRFSHTAKLALLPRGILARRIALSSYSPTELAILVRGLLAEFEHCALARISEDEWLLLASSSPLIGAPAELQVSQALINGQPEVRRDVERSFGASEIGPLLASRLMLDWAGLRRFTSVEHAGISTGFQPGWNARSVFGTESASEHLVQRVVTQAAELRVFQANFSSCACTNKDAWVAHALAQVFMMNRQGQMALELVNWGLKLNPEQPDLLADRLILTLEEEPHRLETAIERIAKTSFEPAVRVGVDLQERGQYQLAGTLFEQLTRIRPTSVTAWRNLAAAYEHVGRLDDARRAFGALFSLDPAIDTRALELQDGPKR